jgi:hypothetical protein
MNAYGFASGDPVNFSDPMGLCPPKDDNKADCPADAGKAPRSALQKVSDFSAGFGDFVSFGGTKAVRNAWDCSDCVDYKSSSYTVGEVAGGVTGAAEAGLGAARAAGWTSRIAIHEAHHTFPIIGDAVHAQVNVWKIGAKGSGFTLLRIPLWPF